MRRRRRHALDLLPLLDVFMVVLFVFATIQERQLGASAQAAAALEAELLRLRGQAGEVEALRRAQEAAAAGEQAARGELSRVKEEEGQLREAIAALRAAAERSAATATTPGAEALRREDVLARLLDHFSVFEIEVDGELRGDAVINHCCYRTEPLAGAWRGCGAVPATTGELQDWLADGAGGLIEALRRTRGGNALTVVRQNERATWRIGRKLEEQLRGRFPEHKVYGEGVALHSPACPR